MHVAKLLFVVFFLKEIGLDPMLKSESAGNVKVDTNVISYCLTCN